jgi:predicted aminopeptidase
MRRAAKFVALAVAGLLLGSCSTIGYYWQAMDGQLEILRKRRPLREVVADQTTPPKVRERLKALIPIREFATRELALPDNQSYRSYADLGRPFVIWNVFATEEFSVKPKEWCFPIAGCVPYRGYFSKQSADAFVAGLPAQAQDVYVGGVPAYSTLGYFNDPILNTFVHYPEVELARLIFHELAHQVVYVAGDAMFNESFATAVEEAGLARWLRNLKSEERALEWDQSQARRKGFQSLVLSFRTRLEELYAGDSPIAEKRLRKAQAFADMKAAYASLKQEWGGYSGYDRWFGQELNNAHLAAIAIYTQFVPAFQKMFEEQGGDFSRFYAAIKDLAKRPKADRDALLSSRAAVATSEAAIDR